MDERDDPERRHQVQERVLSPAPCRSPGGPRAGCCRPRRPTARPARATTNPCLPEHAGDRHQGRGGGGVHEREGAVVGRVDVAAVQELLAGRVPEVVILVRPAPARCSPTGATEKTTISGRQRPDEPPVDLRLGPELVGQDLPEVFPGGVRVWDRWRPRSGAAPAVTGTGGNGSRSWTESSLHANAEPGRRRRSLTIWRGILSTIRGRANRETTRAFPGFFGPPGPPR